MSLTNEVVISACVLPYTPIQPVMDLVYKLNQSGVPTELNQYFSDRLGKQFEKASSKEIPYVLIVGLDEVKRQEYGIKNVMTGEQGTLSLPEIIKFLE